MITLVLGGARSGKSELAEQLVAALPPPVTYIATAGADDSDFAARIDAHRARRPATWRTLEAGSDLVGALAGVDGTVLIDSLGTWVAAYPGFDPDADGLCAEIRRREGATVIVSEEVGLGVHPSTTTGGRFRDALGLLNREVSAVADDVLLVVAGRALRLDGPPVPWRGRPS